MTTPSPAAELGPLPSAVVGPRLAGGGVSRDPFDRPLPGDVWRISYGDVGGYALLVVDPPTGRVGLHIRMDPEPPDLPPARMRADTYCRLASHGTWSASPDGAHRAWYGLEGAAAVPEDDGRGDVALAGAAAADPGGGDAISWTQAALARAGGVLT